MQVGESVTTLVRQARPLRPSLQRAAVAAAAGVAVVLAFLALGAVAGEPFQLFSKEPVETLGGRPYTGWLANLGSAVWLSAASAALLAGVVLRRCGRGQTGSFLLGFGLYTALLVVDDLFLVHESLNSNGFPEELLYLGYGVAVVWLLAHFRNEVVRNHGLLIVLALGLWAASVGFDVLQETWGVHLHVLEDGAKVVGIAVWTCWLVGAALRELTALVADRPAPTEPERDPAPASRVGV